MLLFRAMRRASYLGFKTLDCLGLSGNKLLNGSVCLVEGAPVANRSAGDYQRRARLIYQNVVGLVHDCHIKRALNGFVGRQLEVVSQEVEPELPQRAIHNLLAVRIASFLVAHRGQNRTHRNAERFVDRREPVGVPRRQIVV